MEGRELACLDMGGGGWVDTKAAGPNNGSKPPRFG